jgi:hypothetical protein
LPFTQIKPLAQFLLLDVLIVNYRLGTPVFVLLIVGSSGISIILTSR